MLKLSWEGKGTGSSGKAAGASARTWDTVSSGCAGVAGAGGACRGGRCKEREVGPDPEGPCVLSQELECYPESHGYC